MRSVRVVLVVSLGIVFGGESLVAQSPLRYREYALESSVASVVEISGARTDEIKTLHERPARIQEIEWRVPYGRAGGDLADPVRDVRFRFCDDKLYQMVVTYDRGRTEGLTPDDLIESLTATYGKPLLSSRGTGPEALPRDVAAGMAIVATWGDSAAGISLARGTYAPQYQLSLTSKPLHATARAAIEEALRLDTQEAPQRELDRRQTNAADAIVASEKARVINKAAFRP